MTYAALLATQESFCVESPGIFSCIFRKIFCAIWRIKAFLEYSFLEEKKQGWGGDPTESSAVKKDIVLKEVKKYNC